MLLEVCCSDIDSVMAAKQGGAHRVELCSRLDLDGLTPSRDLVDRALATGIRVHVLIRPREGDFVYNEQEAQVILTSIKDFINLGVHGIVFGALTPDGSLDVPLCQKVIEVSQGLPITFHRAFDVCANPLKTFDEIVSLGFKRLLTSGHEQTALQGVDLIRTLVQRSGYDKHTNEGPSIIVMPGSGISPDNVASIIKYTGASEVHGTLRELVDGKLITTVSQVKKTLKELHNITNTNSFLN